MWTAFQCPIKCYFIIYFLIILTHRKYFLKRFSEILTWFSEKACGWFCLSIYVACSRPGMNSLSGDFFIIIIIIIAFLRILLETQITPCKLSVIWRIHIPNLVGWGGSNFTILPWWFSLNKSETTRAVTLEFCRIKHNFIRDVRAKFGIPNSPQSPVIGQNSDGGISDFRMSGQSLVKGNCHNSRTSDDTDMELGPVTKLDKRNKATSKKLNDEVMSENCYVFAIFQFMANLEESGSRIPDV